MYVFTYMSTTTPCVKHLLILSLGVCAAEWAACGVRVNSISPGHTLTPMTAHADDDMKNAWLANTPMGRLGVPADYQGAVVFLASDASAYATGHDLVVDGGYTLW